MKDVFVYGTLLNDEVLALVLNRVPNKLNASLYGYKRVAVRGQAYPAIQPDENGEVVGALLAKLTESELAYLDEYEGCHYERKSLVVHAANKTKVACETYVFKPEYYPCLSSEAWSNEHFRSRHLAQFLNALSGSS